jgi:predicted Zn-dependent protease with MMP-like domain
LVEEALAEVPVDFAEFLEEVPVEVRARPTAEQMESVGTRRGNLLLGLYHGRPRTRRSVEESGVMPDVIYIFQDSIEQVVGSEAELIQQVRTTVLHEVGHHFGMSEEDLEELGYG